MYTPRRITLLTDFGTADGYVAALKGVIAGIAPLATVDDAAHDVPAGDVAFASWTIAGYAPYYPMGTVHVAVVDPTVGSARRALAANIDGRFFVAPDNGLLTQVLEPGRQIQVVAIESTHLVRDVVSSTFHGRDVFAPIAAHLANGLALDDIGSPVADAVRLPTPVPVYDSTGITGVVVHIDRFGNLITNIPADRVGEGSQVRIAGAGLRLRRTYADAQPGEALALIGSRGLVEIAVRDGSAAEWYGVQRLAEVRVRK